MGLLAHVAAFGRPFSLRSGADLRPSRAEWTWLGSTGDRPFDAPDLSAATDLFAECTRRAEQAGLPVGDVWADEALVLTPAPNLAEAIRKSWPVG
ncbi:MAG TPA: hypothetical protein VM942_04570 [Acidimicrobiales bacterium]|nr:hypothetical protein [Acidimicrobiales bacterium]